MGYAQELARRLGGFSNFALSLSIICILAGGVTSFHLGLCSVGGASIGLGWPLVSLFALAVAATMGQLASAFPTAGGLYHWSAILGGRGWGWATAWFNLAGLITVLAAINVGTYRFAMAALGPGPMPAELDLAAQAIGVVLITASQAAVNHLGIGATARLTDFSGYWILLVAAALTVGLLAFAPGLDPSRLVTFANYSGSAGGGVWPATEGLVMLFALGVLLPAYTITGFDASAHAAEETVGASASVPRGIVRSVLVSGVAGWVLLCAVVLAAPSLSDAAAQGEGAFLWIMTGVLPRALAVALCVGIVVAQYLCGLATVTSASRMAYAFARDGGLPFSAAVRWVCPRRRSPAVAIWARRRGVGPVHPAHPGLLDDHRRLHDLPLRLVRAAGGPGGLGVRPDLDGDGALGPRALVSAAGLAQRGRLRRADRDRHAAAQRAIGLGRGGVRDRAGRRVVRRRAPPLPRAASRGTHPDLSSRSDASGGGTSWTHRERLNRSPAATRATARRRPTILEQVRARTPARILTGRAGSSYRTSTYLELRSDHAAARDAVMAELDLDADLGAAFVAEWGLFEVPTMARTKAEYLLRPELGRSLDPAARAAIAALCPAGADLQVAIADGLSAAAVRAQVPALLADDRGRGRPPGLAVRPAVLRPARTRGGAQRHRRAAGSGGGRPADRRTPRPGDRREPLGLHGLSSPRRARRRPAQPDLEHPRPRRFPRPRPPRGSPGWPSR